MTKPKSKKKVLVLGAGYTGKKIAETLRAWGFSGEILETSRKKSLVFNLADESSWKNLDEHLPAAMTFWTFPAEPAAAVEGFLRTYGPRLGKIVALGTTGSYQVESDDAEVNEDSPVDQSDPRVKGEELILEAKGILVRSAGIYGPDRNPIRWLEDGKAGPSPKFVNFIHVEDLAAIVVAAAELGKRGATYIASDAHPFRWQELIDQWIQEFRIHVPEYTKTAMPSRTRPQRPSKRVIPRRTLKELGVAIQHEDVLEGVRSLMAESLR